MGLAGQTSHKEISYNEIWPFIFRTLSDMYGWTPDQISEMTLNQIHYYLRNGDDESSEKSDGFPAGIPMTPKMWKRFIADRKGKRNGV